MPLIWSVRDEVEFFIVGRNPPAEIKELDHLPNVHVTGFVPQIQPLLASMSLMLCPWLGQFGFRSRIIEVMALGLPVVATPDAVFGMEIEDGAGLFLHESDEALAYQCLDLLQSPEVLAEQSRLARHQVEQSFSYSKTYGRFASTLLAMLEEADVDRKETGP